MASSQKSHKTAEFEVASEVTIVFYDPDLVIGEVTSGLRGHPRPQLQLINYSLKFKMVAIHQRRLFLCTLNRRAHRISSFISLLRFSHQPVSSYLGNKLVSFLGSMGPIEWVGQSSVDSQRMKNKRWTNLEPCVRFNVTYLRPFLNYQHACVVDGPLKYE